MEGLWREEDLLVGVGVGLTSWCGGRAGARVCRIARRRTGLIGPKLACIGVHV